MTPPRPSPLEIALACFALACATGQGEPGDDGQATDPTSTVDPARAAVAAARDEFPTYLDLHTQVIARTCTPNMGVCHNIKEYPDLHTPQTMLGILDQPCNLAEEDPQSVFNGCERVGDTIALLGPSNPEFSSEIAHISQTIDPSTGQPTVIFVHTRDPIPNAMLDPSAREGIRVQRASKQGLLEVGALIGKVAYERGGSVLRIEDAVTLTPEERALLETDIVPGDPNRDGVFGGSADPFKLLVPGDPEHSYLLQRILGTVPGSPMPLANEPLKAAEIVALACWIEGLAGAQLASIDDAIDYDDCRTAAHFGVHDPDSGHALSRDVQPIFDQRCATAGCHDDAAAAAGLVLTRGQARAHLLAESTQLPGVPRVEPGNPTASYLIDKLTGSSKIRGSAMPPGATGGPTKITDDQLAVIRAWIVAGAPED